MPADCEVWHPDGSTAFASDVPVVPELHLGAHLPAAVRQHALSHLPHEHGRADQEERGLYNLEPEVVFLGTRRVLHFWWVLCHC